MKLKYYLRGLGIGIIITAVILAIASPDDEKALTDEEIIQRAEQLGMVMPDETEEQEPDETEVQEPDETAGDVQEKNDTEANQGEGSEPDAGSEPGDDKSNEHTDTLQEPTTDPVMVTVEIKPGEYSDKISQKLVEAGLIVDAEEFNRYLMDNGIDSMIAVGQHQIPQGASEEEIARILCDEPLEQ